jgi:uncharacterized glyoxalase superfamily protein PhnB
MFAYYVPDPGAAADWYCEHFEFEILGDHRTDSVRRWVTASPPGATWQIAFSDVNVHGEGELADRFRAELGFAPHFMLIVGDVDAFVTRAAAKGAEVVDAPADGPFGRQASVKDLYGDVITVTSASGWAYFRSQST